MDDLKEEKKEEVVEEKDKITTEKKEEPDKGKSSDEATRKFAEGANKAEKNIFAKFGVSSMEELEKKVNGSVSQTDYETLSAKVICSDLDIKKDYREDVIAIVKGKGLPITEESFKSVLSSHPEWKNDSEENSKTVKIGALGGKDKPDAPDERELAKKIFS